MAATPFVRPLRPSDHAEWLRLRVQIWPDPPEPLVRDVQTFHETGVLFGHRTVVFVADRGDGRLGGFVELSDRPFAQGYASGPLAYVEGWFVDPDLRRTGVGRAMMEAGIAWAAGRGFEEVASDCWSSNHTSYLAHRGAGFEVADRSIVFRRKLAADVKPRGDDSVALVRYAPWVQAATDFVRHPDAGGIDVFLGTTRSETHADGRTLAALEYEAYEEMAVTQMQGLAARAGARPPIMRLSIVHCLYRVSVGDPSVVIAVSAAHRAEAFEACRWLIDALKAEVAIWKKEVWTDGSTSRVEGTSVRV